MEESGTVFYRCCACTGVVSPWMLRKYHACKKCGGTKVRPSDLSLFEKVVQIIRHPLIWKWPRG